MFGLMKVFGGVLVLGRIAAANVTADQTFPEMDPCIAHLQAFLAAFATRLDLANFFYVGTGCLRVWHYHLRTEYQPSAGVRAALLVSLFF
jgi:hypothetical protein